MEEADVIRLAREAGFPDSFVEAWLSGHKGFAALVRAQALEDAAAKCEERHANGNRKYTHADECATAIRGMK